MLRIVSTRLIDKEALTRLICDFPASGDHPISGVPGMGTIIGVDRCSLWTRNTELSR